MAKTIRLSDEKEYKGLHKKLLKIQGEIQAETGEFTSMDVVIEKLIESYQKKK